MMYAAWQVMVAFGAAAINEKIPLTVSVCVCVWLSQGHVSAVGCVGMGWGCIHLQLTNLFVHLEVLCPSYI